MVVCVHMGSKKTGKWSRGLSPDGSSPAHPSSSDAWLRKINLVHYAVSLMLLQSYLICYSGETRNSKLLINWFLARSLVQLCYPAHIHLPRLSVADPIVTNHRKRLEGSEQAPICRAAGRLPQWLTKPFHAPHFMVTLPCHRRNAHPYEVLRRKVLQVCVSWLRGIVTFASPDSMLGSPLLEWIFSL